MTKEHKDKISVANTGKKRTLEARAKMRDAKIGKPRPDLVGHPMYKSKERNQKIGIATLGRFVSKETKIKKSIAMKGKNTKFGGPPVTPLNRIIRGSLEYRLWRESVFKRDNWTCVWCGARSAPSKPVILNADHIKPFAYYPELRFAIDNGRTLCVPCHKTTDTYKRKLKN